MRRCCSLEASKVSDNIPGYRQTILWHGMCDFNGLQLWRGKLFQALSIVPLCLYGGFSATRSRTFHYFFFGVPSGAQIFVAAIVIVIIGMNCSNPQKREEGRPDRKKRKEGRSTLSSSSSSFPPAKMASHDKAKISQQKYGFSHKTWTNHFLHSGLYLVILSCKNFSRRRRDPLSPLSSVAKTGRERRKRKRMGPFIPRTTQWKKKKKKKDKREKNTCGILVLVLLLISLPFLLLCHKEKGEKRERHNGGLEIRIRGKKKKNFFCSSSPFFSSSSYFVIWWHSIPFDPGKWKSGFKISFEKRRRKWRRWKLPTKSFLHSIVKTQTNESNIFWIFVWIFLWRKVWIFKFVNCVRFLWETP